MKRFAVGAGLVLAACGGDPPGQDGIACTTEIRPGIVVTVVDDATGAPISCGARALITADGYAQAVENPPGPACSDSMVLSGAHERPGTYTVTVSKPTYRDFTVSSVVVNSDACHVFSTQVTARLIASP